jgi:hypothetical protein
VFLLQEQAVLLPSDPMDFQRGWGSSYSAASIKDASEDLYHKAKLLIDGPAMTPVTTDMVQNLLPTYIGDFMDYFGVEPLMFSMHASDCQYSIYSIFSHALSLTEMFEGRLPENVLDNMKANGRLAWDELCFASSYGPGGFICPTFGAIDAAWGPRPFEMNLDKDIATQVYNASREVPSSNALIPRMKLMSRLRIASPSSLRSSETLTGRQSRQKNGRRFGRPAGNTILS